MATKLNLQRQSFLGANSETVLGRSKAALVGLGGGGSHIAQQLAHIGLGHFLVIKYGAYLKKGHFVWKSPC